jgi:hypothetical protein
LKWSWLVVTFENPTGPPYFCGVQMDSGI